jgi:3-methyl-2-oxobutanoate hydroxymethyltransferase
LDILGAYDKLAPKFSKIYSNVGESCISALTAYKNDVKNGTFPVSDIHTYKMSPGEEEKFQNWIN